MKEKIKIIIALMLLTIIIFISIPSVAMAAWWNPLSWKIFSWIHKAPEPSGQALEIEKLKKEVEELKKNIVSVTPTPKPTLNIEGLKNNIISATPTPKPTVKSDNIFCNGKYWLACPLGQKFYCPTSGDAQCNPIDSVFCNGKYWTACSLEKKFYCPATGDAQCLTENKTNPINPATGKPCLDSTCSLDLQLEFLKSDISGIMYKQYSSPVEQQIKDLKDQMYDMCERTGGVYIGGSCY